MMDLKLSVPASVLLKQPVSKIVAEAGTSQAVTGSFCVLPRHTDYLTALVPGILILTDSNGHEIYFAIDHGLLVKRGQEVFVSVHRAIRGIDLGSLRQTVHEQFNQLGESDRKARTAIAGLEANFLRKFLEMQKVLS